LDPAADAGARAAPVEADANEPTGAAEARKPFAALAGFKPRRH
jgi:hypothetical protein